MSTESTRRLTDLVNHPAALEVRCPRAGAAAAREITRSTATEAHPYSSFEQGGVRRFDHPEARPPRFRIS